MEDLPHYGETEARIDEDVISELEEGELRPCVVPGRVIRGRGSRDLLKGSSDLHANSRPGDSYPVDKSEAVQNKPLAGMLWGHGKG